LALAGAWQIAVALIIAERMGPARTGGRWPVDGGRAESGSVLVMSAEDDPADTIRPRLEAAGADLDRCHIIGMVREIGEGDQDRQRVFSMVDDLPLLPNDLEPERHLTLREADQAREDFAQILDELDFVRSQIARLPTKSEVRCTALRLTLGALAAVVVALLLIR